jgi:hypothetical protein
MRIKDVAETHAKWVDDMGWHNKSCLEYLALIASEVGEAVNECRGFNPSDKFGSELAAIILRTLDISVVCGVDIEAEIKHKMEKNLQNGTRGRVK